MKPTSAYRRREQQLKPTKPELHTQNPKPKNNNNTNNLSTSAPYSLQTNHPERKRTKESH
jgi:hypothetical protein